MYSRRLDNQVLSFGHEGVLYKDSFLKYDHQTRSLWVHVTGRCIAGVFQGRRLNTVASVVTSWADWKRRYPDSLVLEEKGYPHFLGTYLGLDSGRASDYAFCLTESAEPKAYPFRALRESEVVSDTHDDEALLIVFSRSENRGQIWDRELDQEILLFSLVRKDENKGLILQDAQTGSLWSGLEGVAVEGILKGKRLRALRYHPILLEAFQAFYPEGEIYGESP